MKKGILFFVLLLVISYLFAFEGGGLFSSSLNFDIATPAKNDNVTSFSNSNKLSLWMRQNIDQNTFYNFAMQGSAYFKMRKYIAPINEKLLAKAILDIDILKFTFFVPLEKNGNLFIEVGRRGLIDSTGIIMSQPFDGVFIQYRNPHFSLLTSLSFTGLLNANTTVLNDANIKPTNSIYSFTKNYLALMALFHVPILKSSYSLYADSLNYFEVKNNGNIKSYLTIGVKGPIIKRLFFSVSFSGSYVKEKVGIKAGILATGAIAYYFMKYNTKVGLNMQYAQGGKNSFQTFTLRHVSGQFYSPFTNTWNTGIKMSIKPLKELYVEALCNIICKAEKSNGSIYRGFEWIASTNYTIKRDINVETSLGQFIKRDNSFLTFINLKGIISF
ncbi:MAG: hypothetical protein ACTTKH_02190 [Treponema sp.]